MVMFHSYFKLPEGNPKTTTGCTVGDGLRVCSSDVQFTGAAAGVVGAHCVFFFQGAGSHEGAAQHRRVLSQAGLASEEDLVTCGVGSLGGDGLLKPLDKAGLRTLCEMYVIGYGKRPDSVGGGCISLVLLGNEGGKWDTDEERLAGYRVLDEMLRSQRPLRHFSDSRGSLLSLGHSDERLSWFGLRNCEPELLGGIGYGYAEVDGRYYVVVDAVSPRENCCWNGELISAIGAGFGFDPGKKKTSGNSTKLLKRLPSRNDLRFSIVFTLNIVD